MNKLFLLAVSVMALGLALPAVAEDTAEVAVDAAVEVCVDEHGEEIECAVEEEHADEMHEDHADEEHHDEEAAH